MMTQGEANTISVGDTVKSMGETRSMEKELCSWCSRSDTFFSVISSDSNGNDEQLTVTTDSLMYTENLNNQDKMGTFFQFKFCPVCGKEL